MTNASRYALVAGAAAFVASVWTLSRSHGPPPSSASPAPTASASVAPPNTDKTAKTEKTSEPAPPKASVSPMFKPRDINHVLSTGQSLSVGAASGPAISKTQPYANLMFNTGVIAGREGLTAFVPLVEGGVAGDVETMSSAFANLVTKMAREELDAGEPGRSHDLLVSVHGISGTPYVGLKKGTVAFAAGIAQATAATRLAKELGKSYVVRAVTTVHGESDHQAGNTAYERDLAEWQATYETDVRAITRQDEPIPMLQTQMSAWTHYGQATSIIPAAQLAATLASKGKIVLVGPKYHLEYAADGVHLTAEGYRHMGEDYAKVYRAVILEGRQWEPLRPLSVSRAGRVITVKLRVPVPPLVLDETLVKDPGSYGFELAAEASGAPAIERVGVTGPDTVAITLADEPKGPLRLRYAHTGAPGASGGPQTGPRGNLRDSDATRSRSGHPLHNWCVHFDEAVH